MGSLVQKMEKKVGLGNGPEQRASIRGWTQKKRTLSARKAAQILLLNKTRGALLYYKQRETSNETGETKQGGASSPQLHVGKQRDIKKVKYPAN